MSKTVDPKEFGLPPRTLLEQVTPNTIAIVMMRKSRIIMADGRKILEKARTIQKIRPEVRVSLRTSAPVCSKTLKFLEREGISIVLG